MLLEIIAMTVEDARRIEACGADRIELVSALTEGGLTPSYSMIKAVLNAVKIPVNVMIRHHAKHFVYTDEEIALMAQDIEVVKSLGANGVVFGNLTKQNQINDTQLKTLLAHCEDLEVTFHKAIDETNVVESIAYLSQFKEVTNVLTAGGPLKISDNVAILNEMCEASGHLNVLLGGGLSLANIQMMKKDVKTTHFHFGTAVRENHSPFGEIDCEQLRRLVALI